jgi:hypothetical protein
LSIYIINPSCNPRMHNIHKTLWATRMYWLSLVR